MVFTTNQPTTSTMENPGPGTQGPVLAQVGTTALPSGWTDSVLVNDSLITTELSNTVSLRQSEQDPFNPLTRHAPRVAAQLWVGVDIFINTFPRKCKMQQSTAGPYL